MPQGATETLADARTALQHGQAEAALDRLDALVKSAPETAGLDRLRGNALYSLDRLSVAETAFAEAVKKDPHDLESVQMRALTLFRLGRPADAVPLLESAHATSAQTRVDPSYLLALCYLDTRRFDDARGAFAAQYGFAPDSGSAYLLAARMLLRREFVPQAELFAKRALELDPQLPLAHELLGEIALAQNQIDVAIMQLRQERERNPLEGITYERLGDASERKGDYAGAEQVLQQAILLLPNSTGPYILLGRAHLKENDPAGAVPFLQKAEAMDPANYMTHNLLAQSYRTLGRSAEATREVNLTEQTQAAPKQAAQP